MAGSRLPQDAYDSRVQTCYTLRFENDQPFGVKEWLQFCDKQYGDKSQQQYTKIWSDAGDIYNIEWKDRLQQLLGPATEKIAEHLYGPDGRLSDAAIAKIFKYTGNEIEKIDSNIKQEVNFKVNFGRD